MKASHYYAHPTHSGCFHNTPIHTETNCWIHLAQLADYLHNTVPVGKDYSLHPSLSRDCYYKLNNVANTIYYYEKALLLNPLNSDATNNLEFAKRMTIDRIEELPKTFLQRLEINYIQKFSYNQWALITVICSFLTAFLFLLFYFSRASQKKRTYFISSMLLLILCVVSTTITYNQYHTSTSAKFAIIFASKVTVKNAPTDTANEIFTLHEGTKINVLDAVDNWKKIRLADGKVGWISADALKEI